MLIDIPEKVWKNAPILASMRRKANSGRRSHHDRGERTNQRNDILGIAGEAVFYQWLKDEGREEDAAFVRSRMFQPGTGGQVPGPDGGSMDAKLFNIGGPNRFAAINLRKHESLEDSCTSYFGVLSCLQSKYGFIMILPYDDVSQWEERDFGYGDPALVKELTELLSGDLLAKIKENLYP